jgi:hypothetical protein
MTITKNSYGIYDFDALNLDQVICYSDEEGGNPFKDSISGVKLVDGIIDDIIDDIPEKTGLIFLGDVQDNGPYSITLLKTFIKMKEKNPDRVILITGNRDMNKLRFADECLFSFRFEENRTFKDYLDFIMNNWGMNGIEFKYDHTDLEIGVNIPGIYNNTDNKIKNLFENKNDPFRINKIYENTMGQEKIRMMEKNIVQLI